MSEASLKEYVYGLAKKVPDYYDDFGLRVWIACYGQFLAGPVIWYMKNNPGASAGDISRFIREISDEQEKALDIYEQENEHVPEMEAAASQPTGEAEQSTPLDRQP